MLLISQKWEQYVALILWQPMQQILQYNPIPPPFTHLSFLPSSLLLHSLLFSSLLSSSLVIVILHIHSFINLPLLPLPQFNEPP
ncbi:hypothetical protein RIF29_35759 [Crotalaria pallida]|uniref:Uncharacterized protein n=1 Tax=Crotalaria pallida TaxID=3830 RepID=A0AAN9HY47_CROPI